MTTISNDVLGFTDSEEAIYGIGMEIITTAKLTMDTGYGRHLVKDFLFHSNDVSGSTVSFTKTNANNCSSSGTDDFISGDIMENNR